MAESSRSGGPDGGRETGLSRIGRYQLVDKLGQGGMGVVYRAFDTLLQRDVALKLISGTLESEPDRRERFFREARAAGQLSHPNIITIYDLGEHDGQPYLAMELLKGEDLQTRLAGPDRMSVAHKVDLAMQLCDGLEYAHAHGVVHRDVKPANVFLTDSGVAKILDFGLARLVTSELTDSNMMMGTVNYMAPEQVRGERADRRSDIFSLGVVFYELLGGRKAFEGDSFAATLYKILQEEPAPLGTLDAALPSDLIAIVGRALAKPRDERYQQMSDMLRDLAVYRQELVARDPGSGGRHASTTVLLGSTASERPLTPPRGIPRPPSVDSSPPPPSQSQRTPASGDPAASPDSGRRGRLRALWAPAAMVVIALAGVAFWNAQRVPPAAPSAAPAPVQPAVDRTAAAAAVARAARALEAGDLAEARRQSEAALGVDPQSSDAQRLRDRVAAVQRGLLDARTAYDAGRYEEASRAAGDVLTLVPGQPEARKLMADAAARSRGQAAVDARVRVTEAKSAARAAGAQRLAAAAYGAALDAERAAGQLYTAGHPGDATLKFYEAVGLFRSAELSARTAAAASSTAPAPSAAAAGAPARTSSMSTSQTMGPSPPTGQTASPASPPPPTPAEPPRAQAPLPTPPSASPSSPPASSERPETATTSPGTDAAATPAPSQRVPLATSGLPAAREPTAESAIADLLARYRAALETRDLETLKRLWPALGGAQEAALRGEFQHATRIAVEIVSPRIHIDGVTATATFVRRYELGTTDGQRLATQSLTTMSLRRTAAGWVIDRLRFDPLR